jgi:hypothetical protein
MPPYRNSISRRAVGRPARPRGFEIAFADDTGEQRLSLLETWHDALESCLRVRSFPSHKGQRHHSGQWWTAVSSHLTHLAGKGKRSRRSGDHEDVSSREELAAAIQESLAAPCQRDFLQAVP